MAINMEDLQKKLRDRGKNVAYDGEGDRTVTSIKSHATIEQFYAKAGRSPGTALQANKVLDAMRQLYDAGHTYPTIYVTQGSVVNFLISLKNEDDLTVNDVKESSMGQCNKQEYIDTYTNTYAEYMTLWHHDEMAVYRDDSNPMPAFEMIEICNENTVNDHDEFLYEIIEAKPEIKWEMIPHALDESMIIPTRMLYVTDTDDGLVINNGNFHADNRPDCSCVRYSDYVMLLNASVAGNCERAFIADLLDLPEVQAFREMPRKYGRTNLNAWLFYKAQIAICNAAREYNGLEPLEMPK